MTIQKIELKPGINRENTRYANEGGWYESDKVRFRQGKPEKIGGWVPVSQNTFVGVCRSLWNWVTLAGINLVGVGTHLKFYLESGAVYNDITPLRKAVFTLGSNPIVTNTTGGTENIITVTDSTSGYRLNDFVTLAGSAAVGGIDAGLINKEHQIASVAADGNSFTLVVGANATSVVTGGGASVTAAYQINVGTELDTPFRGWGAGRWSFGTYGNGEVSTLLLRLWTQANFGEDLLFAPRGGEIFIWDASDTLTTRATYLSAETGAAAVPTVTNGILVSDISRFVFAYGCNEYLLTAQNPMHIRWSDQESAINWAPSAVNQSGGLTLSKGSKIVTALQARQEVLVWSDTAMYSLQYVGAPTVWGAQLVGENISIASPNAVAYANGGAYWMGKDKFYSYDGRAKPLRCDLRKFVFTDFNSAQYEQVIAGTNESFHEVWWHYPSTNATKNDKYVIYNYLEDIWYYGTMTRTAWLDSGLREHPIAATGSQTLVEHEKGNDDVELTAVDPIHAYVVSTEFDIDDGDKFSFVRRLLPDVSFVGSDSLSPSVTMTLSPMDNSGSGYDTPLSEGGAAFGETTRSATSPIQKFTGVLYIRVRGRQLAMKIESTDVGTAWQSGLQRIDIRPDGRR